MAAADYAPIALYAVLASNFLRVALDASKTSHRIGLAVGAVSMILALVWELGRLRVVSLSADVVDALFLITAPAFAVGAIAGVAYLVDRESRPDDGA